MHHVVKVFSILLMSIGIDFSAHHLRNVSASLQKSGTCRPLIRGAWSRAILPHGCVSFTEPNSGNVSAGVSTVPSRRALRPTLGRFNLRLVSVGSSFTSQAISTLATVRPILWGVAVNVSRESWLISVTANQLKARNTTRLATVIEFIRGIYPT